jgi:hypothetical protein
MPRKNKIILYVFMLAVIFLCIYVVLNTKPKQKNDVVLEKAVISIAFDDNDESIYLKAFPVMKGLNIRGNNYCITNFIGNKGMISREQLQEMYDNGWMIGNHTSLHWNLESRSDREIVALVKNARDQLISNGWVRGASEFVPPENKIDDRILGLIKPYINSSTDGVVGLNSIPVDKYHISRLGVANKKPDEIEKYIDEAITSKKYIHLNFHKIGTNKNALVYPMEDFEIIMKYIALKRDEGLIDVKTVNEITN